MTFGKILIYLGLLITGIGLILNYAPWMINWFGRLPGDIRVEEDNKFLFFPITSMIIVSIVLSILINLFFRK